MSERLAFNLGYNSFKWDDLSVAECKAIENQHGHPGSFWDGWNAAYNGLPNPASDLLVADGQIIEGVNYLSRVCLSCVHRESLLDLGHNWIKPTAEYLDESTAKIFA